MKLTEAQIRRLETFLDHVKDAAYPEPVSEPHLSITRKMFAHVLEKLPLAAGARVLDVGCGQGLALEQFRSRGLRATGITVNAIDLSTCRNLGFDVRDMDQSFLDFPDGTFEFIWCRHCLEHSIFPYFTLAEFSRVLKPGGILYVEVPAPDTSCHHEQNQNHYSVLGKSNWISLLKRAGFDVVDTIDIRFTVPAGPDVYWAFTSRK